MRYFTSKWRVSKVPDLPPRYLTYEQYKALPAAIVDEEFKDVVDFYPLTGMRRAEGETVTKTSQDPVTVCAVCTPEMQKLGKNESMREV